MLVLPNWKSTNFCHLYFLEMVKPCWAMDRFTCASGRKRIATDMAANVSKLNGIHMVSIRLELVEV